jgi:hypothetical protein
MLHARKQDLLGMGCTTLYHSYLQEQSSIGVDKQWVKGRDVTGGKLVCKSRAGNSGALPTYEADDSLRTSSNAVNRVMVVV